MDLQDLADRQAIVDLTVSYCWALDTRDWDALDRVFTPDATAVLLSPELHGVAAIKARVAGALERLDATQHVVSTHQIVLDGDAATCRCQLQAQHVRSAAAAGPNYLIGGHYDDRLVRTAHGWRIAHRVLTTTWDDGNAGVARGD